MTRPSHRIVLAPGLIIAAGGGSSTKVVTAWENPEYVPARFERILVIGVNRPDDRPGRSGQGDRALRGDGQQGASEGQGARHGVDVQ
jgi:hypothetical protein